MGVGLSVPLPAGRGRRGPVRYDQTVEDSAVGRFRRPQRVETEERDRQLAAVFTFGSIIHPDDPRGRAPPGQSGDVRRSPLRARVPHRPRGRDGGLGARARPAGGRRRRHRMPPRRDLRRHRAQGAEGTARADHRRPGRDSPPDRPRLHDGAQQRLVSVSLALRALRSRLPDHPRGGGRDGRRGEHGLPTAVPALAARATVPVDVTCTLAHRLRRPWRSPPTTSSRSRSRTWPGTPGRRAGAWSSHAPRTPSSSGSQTTASAGRIPVGSAHDSGG